MTFLPILYIPPFLILPVLWRSLIGFERILPISGNQHQHQMALLKRQQRLRRRDANNMGPKQGYSNDSNDPRIPGPARIEQAIRKNHCFTKEFTQQVPR